jgi:hypothetical protein
MAKTSKQFEEVEVMSANTILEARPTSPSYDGTGNSDESLAPPLSPTPPPPPDREASAFSQRDATELAARRAADAKLQARLRGWKPLTIWYAFWAIVIAIGAVSSLGSGQVGSFLLGAAICAACVKYTHYLYNGGRRRVWFFIW